MKTRYCTKYRNKIIQPKIVPLGDGTNRGIFLKKFVYQFWYKGKLYKMVIPKGFITDGSSIPKALFSLMFSSTDFRTWRAFGPRDYGFCTGIWPQEVLDAAYKYELLNGGVKPWRVKSAYVTLRLVGSIPYNRHRKAEYANHVKHARAYGLQNYEVK